MKIAQHLNYNNKNVTKLAVVCAIGYGLLLLALAVFWTKFKFDGSPSYGRAAAQFLQDGYFNSDYRPPLYSLFLAGSMTVFGQAWERAALFIQILLAMFSFGLAIYLITKVCRSIVGGLIAAVLLSLHLTYHIEAIKQRETGLYVLGMLLLFHLIMFARPSLLRTIFVGILAGLSHLTRPDFVVPLIFIGSLLFLDTGVLKSFVPTRKGILQFALGIVCFLATIAPWQAVVYRVSGKISINSSNTGGVNLWKGNNPYLFQIYPGMEIDTVEPYMRQMLGGQSLEDPASNGKLTKIAIDYIKENPGKTLINTFLKSFILFSPIHLPYSTGEVIFQNDRLEMVNRTYINPLLIANYAIYSLLMFFGLFLGFKNFKQLDQVGLIFGVAVAIFILLKMGIHGILFYEARFRLPLDIIMGLFATYGFVTQYQRKTKIKI